MNLQQLIKALEVFGGDKELKDANIEKVNIETNNEDVSVILMARHPLVPDGDYLVKSSFSMIKVLGICKDSPLVEGHHYKVMIPVGVLKDGKKYYNLRRKILKEKNNSPDGTIDYEKIKDYSYKLLNNSTDVEQFEELPEEAELRLRNAEIRTKWEIENGKEWKVKGE